MDKTLFQKLASEERKQLQDSIRQTLLEIQQLRERIKEDQIDIEQSRIRTEAMLAHLTAR